MNSRGALQGVLLRSEGSIRVWCKNNSDRSGKRFEAHFNYWHIIGDRSFSPSSSFPKIDFLEIGLLIEDPASMDEVNVFIPVERVATDVHDCSEYFRDPAIAEGIFNEALIPSATVATLPCIELRRAASGKPFACVFRVGDQSNGTPALNH
jgi:hypothetical protein